MHKIVLLRHGESEWNKENRFTGWTDVDLSVKGVSWKPTTTGKSMLNAGLEFDLAFTSVLKRAIKTLWLALEEMDLMWIPVVNVLAVERTPLGALQGLNKAETAKKYGEEQVHLWRRSYDVQPPALTPDDDRYPGRDPRYKDLTSEELPLTECLKDTVNRFLPYWHQSIVPEIKAGRRVLIAAHGNSLRALVKYLDKIPDDEIAELNIPTGIPLVYELEDNLSVIRHYYLADPDEVKKMMDAVANQGKAG